MVTSLCDLERVLLNDDVSAKIMATLGDGAMLEW